MGKEHTVCRFLDKEENIFLLLYTWSVCLVACTSVFSRAISDQFEQIRSWPIPTARNTAGLNLPKFHLLKSFSKKWTRSFCLVVSLVTSILLLCHESLSWQSKSQFDYFSQFHKTNTQMLLEFQIPIFWLSPLGSKTFPKRDSAFKWHFKWTKERLYNAGSKATSTVCKCLNVRDWQDYINMWRYVL